MTSDGNFPSEDDYSLMILKNRLAKGEITIDEFNNLKKILEPNSVKQDEESKIKDYPQKVNKKGSSKFEKPKKKLSKKKVVLIGILVFFAFIIAGQFVASPNFHTTKYRIGDYVWVDGINYRVYQTGFADNHNIYDKPNGKYLKVYISITNLENTPAEVYASNFSLIDESGNRYSEATEYGYDSLLTTTLQPNLIISTYVVFDIPINSDPSNYYLEINDENHVIKLTNS